MRKFVAEAAALVHAHTAHAVTLGSAAAQWHEAWRGLGLDFYQVHWFEHLEDHSPLARHVRELDLDRPVMLGEFPSRRQPAEVRRILETARTAGYSGAFVWSMLADDEATDVAAAETALQA